MLSCGIYGQTMHRTNYVCWRISRARLFQSSFSLNFIQENSTSASSSGSKSKPTKEDEEAFKRRRKVEWKRRQGGQTFLDHVIITVKAGKGGNGCSAFHREKFVPYGPPSGGNGGRGADVYILPTPHLTTLSNVPKRVRAENGAHGQGSWLNGRAGQPFVIKVPLGTIVREIPLGDPRRGKDEWEAEEESLEGLGPDERKVRMREKRWVHYPGAAEGNVDRESFLEAETAYYKQERERRIARRKRALEKPIFFDLDKEERVERSPDAPLGVKQKEPLGHLVATGGQGGHGNTHFLTTENRSPKYGTRGQEGERITLELELKLLADVGLVGMPNAGKSTLLRALTGGRAKTAVANYPFTTLNPVLGIVRVAEDGTWEGRVSGPSVFDETLVEKQEESDQMFSGDLAFARTRNEKVSEDEFVGTMGRGHHFDVYETFRFTVSDNPGLISKASENHGLGHSFLRAMERSPVLVYVVDLSAPRPWEELIVLRDELEKYQPGMSAKARMVIANKADLLAEGGDEGSILAAKQKLKQLEDFVSTELAFPAGEALAVVPTSGKYSQNLDKIVSLMKEYVTAARERQ